MHAMVPPGAADGTAPTALAFLDDPHSARQAMGEASLAWLALVPPDRLLGSLGGDGLEAVWLDGGDLCWSLGGCTGRRSAVVPAYAPETARRAAVLTAARVLLPGSHLVA